MLLHIYLVRDGYMRSIYQVFSFDMISKILMGAIGIILIRYMEASEYAIYTFALSIITIVAQTINSTFRRIYIVGYNSFQLEQHKESLLGLILIILLILIGITFPYAHYVNGVYVWIIFMVVGFILVDYGKTIYQQEHNFSKFSIVEIWRTGSFSILTLVLIFLLKGNVSAWQILLIQSFSMILVFMVAFSKKLKIRGMLKVMEALKVGGQIFKGPYKYLLGYTLFVTLLGQLDVLLLKAFSTEHEIATYGSAFRYYSLLLLALGSVNTVFLPVIQNIQNRSELDRLYKKHTKMLTVFIPVVLLGAWLSKWIIPVIDKGKYPDAVLVFQILAISAILSFIFSPHTNFVMKLEKFKFIYYVLLISVIMNILFNIVMIPRLGSLGAALTTLITFGFSNFITFLCAQKYKNDLPDSSE